MGTVHASPKKLVAGMKVVVCWRRDWIPFTWYQRSKGYQHGKWFKGELVSTGKGEWTGRETYVVRINGDEHCLWQGDVIVVRSTARMDSNDLRNDRARRAYREKTQKLAALKAAQRASN